MTSPEPPLLKSMPVASDNGPKIYKVGTLSYTLRGMMVLFAWLLWGDFAFVFFENIFGRFIPLYLKDLHASNSLIGIMMGSIAGGVNLFLLPSLSQWSDGCRTSLGRRIPFLLVATPFTVGSLILVGFAPEIGGWFFHHVTPRFATGVSETGVILSLLCVFVAFFHYFNMVLCNAFNWLLRDVVPLEWMARFLSWFRIMSTVSSIAFSWYVFPYVISHRKEVCVYVGLFYLVTFMAMCWNVKEGEYPPVEVRKDKPGMLKSFGLYFRDCYAVPLYRHYFLAIVLASLSSCAGPFYLLFFRETLALDMSDLGKIFALGSGVTALTYLPMAWLCDKFAPIRVAMAAQFGMFVMAILSFFFIHDKYTLTVFTVVGSAVSVGWGLGNATLTMKLFPSEKFGQFSAGINIFGCGINILGNYLIGLFMDLVHSNYRMAYLWSAMAGLSLIPLLHVYRGWCRHGGPDHYQAPLPE